MTNGDIKARVREIQKAAATATTLTIQEKREYLARVVRAKLTDLPDDSDLWQEITRSMDSVKRKLPDKLRAIAMDNDLSGEGSEANREGVTVVVRIGGQDNGEASFTPGRPDFA